MQTTLRQMPEPSRTDRASPQPANPRSITPLGVVTLIAAVTSLGMGLGCDGPKTGEAAPAAKPPPARVRLEFSPDVASDDPEVNHFVRNVCLTCLDNDYESFRSLWSKREEPIKSTKFQRRWQPVERVAIRKIEPMRHRETGDILYGVVAEFEFGTGAKDPRRDVVFLVQKEEGRWRLARPPKHIVERLLGADASES